MGKEFKGMISAAIADDGAKHGRSADNTRIEYEKALRTGNKEEHTGGKGHGKGPVRLVECAVISTMIAVGNTALTVAVLLGRAVYNH